MEPHRKVVVVIPTKNPGGIFREVVRSVLGQVASFEFEVLIIDSGSIDGTLEYIESLQDKRIRLHQIEPTCFGHGRTRNLAISLTDSEYVAMITHDACPVKNSWLENLVSMADSNARIAGVFGRHIAYSDANLFTKHELEIHFKGFSDNPIVSMDDPLRYAGDIGYRQYLHFFSDNNALIRRAVWESIPYPDVDFAEDQLWAKSIIEAGWLKAYSDEAAVFHSHEYSLIERLQRSYDESFAFFTLFGYCLSPSILAMIKSCIALTRRDIQFSVERELWKISPMVVLLMPFDNFMRVLGHYLGARGDKLSPMMQKILSRDYRVHIGMLRLKK